MQQLVNTGSVITQAMSPLASARSSAAESLYVGFVHRTVITAVHHQDPGSIGDGTGDAQREAIGIRGGRGHLPVRQAKAFAQQLPDGQCVFGRQHVAQAAARLLAQRAHHWRW
jgi:hypothetical protein